MEVQRNIRFTTVLVDDEQLAIENLKLALRAYPEIQVIGVANNKADAKKIIEDLEPDVVFLDINLVSSDGFELLDELKYHDFKVIFATAHNEFALKAFEYSAHSYILKPLQQSALDRAISGLEDTRKLDNSSISKLLELIHRNEESETSQKIALPTAGGVIMRPVHDIELIRSSGNYCFVFFTDDTKVLISTTLKELESQLSPYHFYRVHHSVLINCDHVETYKTNRREVVMKSGESIMVSHRRKADFLKYLKRTH